MNPTQKKFSLNRTASNCCQGHRDLLVQACAAACVLIAIGGTTVAAPVALQNATATFSQTSFGGQPVGTAIDGNFGTGNGWAIYEGTSSPSLTGLTSEQTVVFETVEDISFPGGASLKFTLHHNFSDSQHTLGRFRLSVTADPRSAFADGLSTGGDVTANWTVLSPLTYTATGGATLSLNGDGSILAGGSSPATSVYIVSAFSPLSGITGFRLEVLADPSLPDSGPGRHSPNGNFVLTEFVVEAVPEPSAFTLLGVGALGLLSFAWCRRTHVQRESR